MKTLDFIIIGAQKCATTTLFELLRQHPNIDMPLEKELPFFTGEDCSPAAWRRFAERYFNAGKSAGKSAGNSAGKTADNTAGQAAEPARLWGKATPQYMGDAAVPARMAACMPEARLIAMLRDPLARTRSHFRMAQRRGTEPRDFATAIAASLDPRALARGRAGKPPRHSEGYASEADFYITWSEYGRILSEFRRCFPARQILVIYTSDLETDPRGVLDRVLAYLNLDTAFHPRGLGEVMHTGGGANRIPHGLRVWLRERAPIARLWRLVPPQQQGRIRFLYERFNSRKSTTPLALPAALEEALIAHFARDLRELAALELGMPPWGERYGLRTSSIHSTAYPRA